MSNANLLGGGGSGGGIAIGDPVSGGTPNEILFIDGSGNLGQDPDFTFDSIGLAFTVGASTLGVQSALYGTVTVSGQMDVSAQNTIDIPLFVRAIVGQTSKLTLWQSAAFSSLSHVDINGNFGVRTGASPATAYLTLGAGTAAAGDTPLRFTSGVLNTTSVVGAVEFFTDKYYGTITTGAARKEFALVDAASGLTSGRVPFATTNGRLTDDADLFWDDSNTELRVGANTTKNSKVVLTTEAGDVGSLYLDSTTAPFNTSYGAFDLINIAAAAANNGSPISRYSGETVGIVNPNAISTTSDDDIWATYGSFKTINITGANTSSAFNLNENNTGIQINMLRSGTHTAPELYVVNTGYGIQLNDAETYNNVGGALDVSNYGVVANIAATHTAPVGSLVKTNYGIASRVTSTTNGITSSYGVHLFVQGADTNVGLYLSTISGGTTNWGILDVAGAAHSFKGRLAVGVNVPTSATALLQLAAGSASASGACFKMTSGTDLTTAEIGAWEFGSSRLAFTPSGTTRKRVALTNDVTPTNGQIPIGNGTDFTVASLTAGANVTITPGAGSITIAASGGAGASWTETEIDFGSTPQWSKTFTITDAGVSGSSKIILTPSGNPGSDRTGNDMEWDNILLAGLAGSGQFTLTALAMPGPIVGKRKVFYSIAA